MIEVKDTAEFETTARIVVAIDDEEYGRAITFGIDYMDIKSIDAVESATVPREPDRPHMLEPHRTYRVGGNLWLRVVVPDNMQFPPVDDTHCLQHVRAKVDENDQVVLVSMEST